MYMNWYYLHFGDPVDPAAIGAAFGECAEAIEVKPLYSDSYELFSTVPFNRVKHLLDHAFAGSNFYVCKVKAGFIHVPG